MTDLPEFEPMIISLRAYAEPPPAYDTGQPERPRKPVAPPSPWQVIFDTETTIDGGQSLRIGSYEVRHGGDLREAGLFYEPDAVFPDELARLTRYAAEHDLKLLTREAFVDEIFYGVGYDLRATVIGFNLPFDIARLAIGHASARGKMRGGFTFRLSADKRRPAVQIKHRSSATAFIRFAAPFRQHNARSERQRKDQKPVRRGFFIDVHTLAAALLSRRFTLGSLAEFLGIADGKLETEAHGRPLTNKYIAYAVRDVEVTWACYAELVGRYETFNLKGTPPHQIYSEASIGKAYFKAMGVRAWRAAQPDVPAELMAKIMSAYFGGRSEVRIRRELRQVVLCDFLSMYPTVCTLMRLWSFVVAEGMTWRDTTAKTAAFLDSVTLADLQRPETWLKLRTLVQVKLGGEVFPVRGRYSEQDQATIGLNHLHGDPALWFTLADCIAAKFLTGRAPEVQSAITFDPGPMQAKLSAVAIAGKAGYRVDPTDDDFFKRLIELRQGVKKRRDAASGAERDALDAEQNALKIAANASSYGVFVEINVNERAKAERVKVHNAVADAYEVETKTIEEPGRYFHPILATLITGAARLMLAITERWITDQGLEWAFCDTDSMAIAKPDALADSEFQDRVDRIVAWFEGLNPYAFGGSILKVEEQNYSLDGSERREPLYCWAVSAKRYALFNIAADGRPIIRKASAHGLGHIRHPYDKKNRAPSIPQPAVKLSKIGVDLWQHDLWWTIACAALDGHPDQVALDYHPALGQPAVSRYAATTPPILRWYADYNRNLPYARQVKPFGFLLSFFTDPFYEDAEDTESGRKRLRAWKPAAAFDKDHVKAAKAAFDRETREPVPTDALLTVGAAIGIYHLHSESKFLNGEGLDRGVTQRRHVEVTGVRLIGKEANRWEEQYFLGVDDEAQPDYGSPPPDLETRIMILRATVKAHGASALAEKAGMSAGQVRRALKKGPLAPLAVIERLSRATGVLEAEEAERAERRAELLDWARQQTEAEGIGAFARGVGVDPKNLRKVLYGSRGLSAGLLTALYARLGAEAGPARTFHQD